MTLKRKERKMYSDKPRLKLSDFIGKLRKEKSHNITFYNEKMITRYGRKHFGEEAEVHAVSARDGSIIISEPVTINKNLYEKIKETGSRLND
jgi:hypothetical protein